MQLSWKTRQVSGDLIGSIDIQESGTWGAKRFCGFKVDSRYFIGMQLPASIMLIQEWTVAVQGRSSPISVALQANQII